MERVRVLADGNTVTYIFCSVLCSLRAHVMVGNNLRISASILCLFMVYVAADAVRVISSCLVTMVIISVVLELYRG